jgi:hypothetical protein
MADLLSVGEAWLARTFAASAATAATYARGALSATVALTLGGDVEVAYGNAAVQTATKKAFFPVADLVLGGLPARPAVADVLTWTDADSVIPRVLTLGPWGPDRAAGRRLIEASQTFEVFAQEVGRTQSDARRPTVTPGAAVRLADAWQPTARSSATASAPWRRSRRK